MSKRPHILIINPDEMRWDTMGHMGNRAAYTPTLDRLAVHEAVSFDHAYCQNPVCVPSRCSFLTGLYPHTTGHRTMRYLMREGEESLFSELKAAGYYVWQNGRNDYFAAQKPGMLEHHTDTMFVYEQKQPKPEQKQLTVPYELPEKQEGFTQKMTETVICDDPEHEYSHYHGVTEGARPHQDWRDTLAAIEQIRHIDELGDKPLCLFLGWSNPHPPYQVDKKYYDLIKREEIVAEVKPQECTNKSEMIQKLQEFSHLDGWTDEQWIDMRHVYLAQCAFVDHMVEMLLDALKEAGIYDDTAIFFFSDHGDWCGDFHLAEKAQNCFEDILTRVPFLIKPPKGYEVDPGLASSPVELVDFYATAMEWAGAQYSHDHFGKSLTDVIADRSVKVREYAFSEGGRMPYESQADEWHCEGPDGGGNGGDYYAKKRAQLDNSAHEKGSMITDGKYKYIYRSSGKCEFYDLMQDPQERHNLYGSAACETPEMQLTILKMEKELLKWFQQTSDIVPWDYDSRFGEDRLWTIAQRMVSDEYEDQVRQYIRDTDATIVNVIEYAKKLKDAIGEA